MSINCRKKVSHYLKLNRFLTEFFILDNTSYKEELLSDLFSCRVFKTMRFSLTLVTFSCKFDFSVIFSTFDRFGGVSRVELFADDKGRLKGNHLDFLLSLFSSL